MIDPKNDDEEANLVSYTLVSVENKHHLKNDDLNEPEMIANEMNDDGTPRELKSLAYALMQKEDDKVNDEDVDSYVIIEPLPSSAAAYADPSVYATPEQGTSARDVIVGDSSDETMAFDYQSESDETFSSGFDTSDDDSTDNDMVSITGELDRLSPAFRANEGSKGKPINLASSNEEVTPPKNMPTSSTSDRKGQLFSDTSDESQGEEDRQPVRKWTGH